MSYQLWSWILTIVGVTGFILAGRKVWWCWYVNIGCQGLWFAYAIVTKQYGFIVASAVYTVVFTQNAIRWTKDHRDPFHDFDLDHNKVAMPPQMTVQLCSSCKKNWPGCRCPNDLWQYIHPSNEESEENHE